MPTNSDERDFDEERFNAELLRNPDGDDDVAWDLTAHKYEYSNKGRGPMHPEDPGDLSMDCRICYPLACDDPDNHLGVPSEYTPLANKGCHCGADRDGRDCMCFE